MLNDDRIKIMLIGDDVNLRYKIMQKMPLNKCICVIKQTNNGKTAVSVLRNCITKPNIILFDCSSHNLNEIANVRWINSHFPAIKILVLVEQYSNKVLFQCLECGISGVIRKYDNEIDLIPAAINSIYNGGIYYPIFIQKHMLHLEQHYLQQMKISSLLRHDFQKLTNRESQIAELVAKGLSNSEISEKLTLQIASVRKDMSRILAKLKLHDRTQLAIKWNTAYKTFPLEAEVILPLDTNIAS